MAKELFTENTWWKEVTLFRKLTEQYFTLRKLSEEDYIVDILQVNIDRIILQSLVDRSEFLCHCIIAQTGHSSLVV